MNIGQENPSRLTRHASPSRIALIGANGMLAQAVRKAASAEYEIFPFDLPEFDITDAGVVDEVLGRLRPEVVINCAAYTNVDGCESEEVLATRVNGEGPGNLARAVGALDAALVHISTDYVFGGDKNVPYVEEDPTGPQSAYGRSKLAGEKAIQAAAPEKNFIIRTSWLYGPGGKNFVETILRLAREREELRIVADQFGTPTFTDDLAQGIFQLLRTTEYGIYHFANEGQCSWHEFAEEIVFLARTAGEPLKVRKIRPISTEEYPLPAARPAYSVFAKDKFRHVTGMDIPHWRDSLVHYMKMRSR